MKKEVIWKALFTQTGSELYEVSMRLKRFPSAIITNKPIEKLAEINYKLVEKAYERFIFIPPKPTVEEYLTALKGANIVTLHGYLRILPPEVCYRYRMFNGHPGLITRYPELKGKDPQKRVWESDKVYEHHGHVIHSVISEVDAGGIMSERAFKDPNIKKFPLNHYIEQLHTLAIDNWVAFLREKLLIRK